MAVYQNMETLYEATGNIELLTESAQVDQIKKNIDKIKEKGGDVSEEDIRQTVNDIKKIQNRNIAVALASALVTIVTLTIGVIVLNKRRTKDAVGLYKSNESKATIDDINSKITREALKYDSAESAAKHAKNFRDMYSHDGIYSDQYKEYDDAFKKHTKDYEDAIKRIKSLIRQREDAQAEFNDFEKAYSKFHTNTNNINKAVNISLLIESLLTGGFITNAAINSSTKKLEKYRTELEDAKKLLDVKNDKDAIKDIDKSIEIINKTIVMYKTKTK